MSPVKENGEQQYRLTVEQYHRMGQLGILTENDRVELIDGRLVAKVTHNPPHDAAVSLADHELSAIIHRDLLIRIQSAVTLASSEPEPDVVVVKGPARRYARRHPGPRDILLLVEVAQATLLFDRLEKGREYARARIPIYWIVNLVESQLEVYSQPRGGLSPKYRRKDISSANDLVPVVIQGKEIGRIAVRDLLP